MNILKIDSSPRVAASLSRELSDLFISKWKSNWPKDIITTRDLTTHPVDHINVETITGFYTPTDQLTRELKNAIAMSNEIIAEAKRADVIIVSSPMYNFSVPSVLKAYIDQLIRANETFRVTDVGELEGLFHGKKVFILTVSGVVYKGTDHADQDHLGPYLKTVFKFLNCDVEILSVEGTNTDPEVFQKTLEEVKDRVSKIVKKGV